MSSGESFRIQKVEKELREIIGTYISRHFPSQMLGVTQVRVNKDLRAAKAYISALGKPSATDDQIEELQHHALQIQHEITKQLRMRYCPKLKFLKDEGVSAAQKVDEILDRIKKS